MSYAEAAARGPPQSEEEVSVRHPTTVVKLQQRHGEEDAQLIVLRGCRGRLSRGNADRSYNSRAPPVPEIIPTDRSVDSLIDVDTGIAVVPADFDKQEVKTETQAARIELEQEAKRKSAEEEARKATAEAHLAKKRKKSAKTKAKEISNSPVLLINSLLVTATAGVLGWMGYKKYQAGQLTWKVVGMWTAGVAGVTAADYFISSFLYKKYPPGQKKN
ncbi:hypothetical protein EX30DRAFT_398675 [Ascodesmis nigricans]|uniref:Uncharacterized protein n=1 Tax=Ascodesmis nigricans TaxID=341454 RepID=A0A4S2MJS6_9PEZI|nr:hypothetical protein EX30DRAFT_398675 [Ascodesmis nigricans]